MTQEEKKEKAREIVNAIGNLVFMQVKRDFGLLSQEQYVGICEKLEKLFEEII